MTIAISELRPAGSDLFMDSESYLNDFTESDAKSVYGGMGFRMDSGFFVFKLYQDANDALIKVKGLQLIGDIVDHVSDITASNHLIVSGPPNGPGNS